MYRLTIELIILEHAVQKTSPRSFIVKVVTPQCQHIWCTNINTSVDQIMPYIKLQMRGYQLRIYLDVVVWLCWTHLLVVQAPIFAWINDKYWAVALCFASMRRSCSSQYHGHDGILVFGTTSPMCRESSIEWEVGNDITIEEDEVGCHDLAFVEVAHSVTYRS